MIIEKDEITCDCGGKVLYDKDNDVSVVNGMIIFDVKGHCLKCKKKYQWAEVFALEEIKDVKEF